MGAPAKAAPPHPHAPRSPSRSQKAKAPLGAQPGTVLATAVKAAGPEDRCGEGPDRAVAGGALSASASPREARGCGGVPGRVGQSPSPGAPRPSPAVPGEAPRRPLGVRPRRHMMAQRLRRSAPWKRRAACTCLQRAQPTLLSSSLKSSRMCQLYLAEHST